MDIQMPLGFVLCFLFSSLGVASLFFTVRRLDQQK